MGLRLQDFEDILAAGFQGKNMTTKASTDLLRIGHFFLSDFEVLLFINMLFQVSQFHFFYKASRVPMICLIFNSFFTIYIVDCNNRLSSLFLRCKAKKISHASTRGGTETTTTTTSTNPTSDATPTNATPTDLTKTC